MISVIETDYIERLRHWFLTTRRSFVWRENRTPYTVWISEVMLQQTQADRIQPYFLRWMRLFPDIECLASAEEAVVLKAWEGLGYYSRARSLRKAAQYLTKKHAGKIPDSYDALLEIPGVGPYTAGAVLAFGFHKKHVAVDANVFRLLARLSKEAGDVTTARVQQRIRQLAEQLLPEDAPWEIAEALIELGAVHCAKKPQCTGCPLQENCQAFLHAEQHLYPKKGRKIRYEKKERELFVIAHDRHILLHTGTPGALFEGLYQFPYIESAHLPLVPEASEALFYDTFGIRLWHQTTLPKQQHSFTRFRVTLHPKMYIASSRFTLSGYTWHTLPEAKQMAFAAGHREIVRKILSGF